MEEKLESMEQESKESYDRFLRVSAEFENYKKRAAREMNDFRKFANESFVKAMLPVVDNLDRAIESSNNDNRSNSSVVEGVNMTLKEILKIFEQFGVKPFQSLGKTFDPALHQAVMQEESDDHPEKTILNEFIAYTDLIKFKDSISPRSFTIATYALCGFANFSSIAIQIGGIGSLVPSRRKDFAKLGLKAMIGGTLAAFMTAAIAAMLI